MYLRCRMIVPCALGLCLATLPGCDAANETAVLDANVKEAPDPAKAEASIREAQAGRIAALRKRDVDGAVSVYAPNATLVVPDATPLTDPASIRANYASLLGDDDLTMTVTPMQTWVSAGADFAVTTAKIAIRSKAEDDPVAIDSTSQSVWQRQADGTWKIVSEYNVALPAGGSDQAGPNQVNPNQVSPDQAGSETPVRPNDAIATTVPAG